MLGGDLAYADWYLRGPENDDNHDSFINTSEKISSYTHTYDVPGIYDLDCVFEDASGDPATASWSIYVQGYEITDANVVNIDDPDIDTYGSEFDFTWRSKAVHGSTTVTAEIWADSWEIGINDRKVAEKTYTVTSTNSGQSITDIGTDDPVPGLDHRTWDFYVILKKSGVQVDKYGVWLGACPSKARNRNIFPLFLFSLAPFDENGTNKFVSHAFFVKFTC